MPLSTAAKAALCICPPALMAGTVATVPAAKRAVHHLTAPRHAPRPVRHAAASAPVRPAAVQQQVNCAPGFGGALPPVPLVTYAAPLPDEPAGGGFIGSGAPTPIPGAIGFGGGGGGGAPGTPITPGIPGVPGTTPDTPGVPVTPTTPVTPVPEGPGPGPVPEPSVWLMMIAGVGTLGATLRRRRDRNAGGRRSNGSFGPARRATAGGILWSGSAAVEAGDMAATVAMKSAVASAAGKAMLCVCPAAIIAGSVMTVPPLRQAVHAATIPSRTAVPSLAGMAAPVTLPCLEPTIPVATAAVDGFPATVATNATATRTAARPATEAAAPVPAAAPVAAAAGSSPAATAG